MKKTLIGGLLIFVLLAGTLTACGKKDDDSSAAAAPNVSQQTQQLPSIITATPENGTQNSSAPQLPSLFSSSREEPAQDPAETQAEMPDPTVAEAAPEQPAAPTVNPAAPAPGTAAEPAVQPNTEAAPTAEPQPQPTTAPPQPQPTAPPSQSSWPGSNFMPTPNPGAPTAEPAPAAPSSNASEETITIYGGIEAPASDFLFPYSSTQLLTDADLQYLLSLSARDMHFEAQLGISEIYARYGYTFQKQKATSDYVRARIEDKEWYKQAQSINPSPDQETLRWHYFNDIERQNVQILLDFQNTYDHYTG